MTVDDQNRRPDLELLFAQDGFRDILICVEVKHGTPPHTQQLLAYVTGLRDRLATDGVVILLAPRTAYPFDKTEVPRTVPQLRWQDTAMILRAYEPEPASEIGEFLVDELQSFLKEERLMDPDRVTPEHLVAFENHTDAFAALDLVCQQADAYVSKFWTAPGPDHTDSRAGETWWAYPASPKQIPVAEHWRFAWHLFQDSTRIFRDGRVGVPRFAAGVSAARGKLQTVEDAAIDKLRASNFELLSKEQLKYGDLDYVWRLAYPADVIAGPSLRAQGAAVGKWIAESFELAAAALAKS